VKPREVEHPDDTNTDTIQETRRTDEIQMRHRRGTSTGDTDEAQAQETHRMTTTTI